jgi:Zn-dependent protease/predicted transcriptional regulator
MFGKGIPLFRLGGIPVELNLSWVVVVLLVTWSFSTGYYPQEYPGMFSSIQLWIIGLLTALLLFASILLHEFSHAIVASRNGIPIRKITLFMFGGIAHMKQEASVPRHELKMAAAGPAMTLLLVACFIGLSLLAKDLLFVYALFQSLADVNIAVFLFNMVPGFPLDGGRILRAIIWERTGDLQRATRIASRIGGGFAIVLMVLGGLIFLFMGNFIGGMWLVVIGFFLRNAARSGYFMVLFKEGLKGLHVSEVMRQGVTTVDEDIDLQQLVDDYFLVHHLHSFPVVSEGKLVGMVSLGDVKEVPRSRWPVTAVREIMDTGVREFALHVSEPAEKLMSILLKRDPKYVPVIDDHMEVVGLVTKGDLMEVIQMVASLKR